MPSTCTYFPARKMLASGTLSGLIRNLATSGATPRSQQVLRHSEGTAPLSARVAKLPNYYIATTKYERLDMNKFHIHVVGT
jgi:hypothetical protein